MDGRHLQMLKDMKWGKRQIYNDELGPAIAGVYNKRNGKIYTTINDMNGNVLAELSTTIGERIENMPDDIFDSYIEHTRGAGSHAEIYAVNKALLDDPNATVDDLLVYVNRTLGTSKPVTEISFETCPHCEYILDGFHILSNN